MDIMNQSKNYLSINLIFFSDQMDTGTQINYTDQSD